MPTSEGAVEMSMLRTLRNALAFTAFAAATVIGLAPSSHAQGVVTTKGRYSAHEVSAPVRQGRHGYEVRLPGGTWVGCKGDCAQTLRESTVDFWQTQRERAGR
jgi:hypothetical protein